MINQLIILSCSGALFAPSLLTHTKTCNFKSLIGTPHRVLDVKKKTIEKANVNKIWDCVFPIRGNFSQAQKPCFVNILKNLHRHIKRRKITKLRKNRLLGSLSFPGLLCLVIANCNEAFTLHYTQWIIWCLFKTLGVAVVHTHLHSQSLFSPLTLALFPAVRNLSRFHAAVYSTKAKCNF